VFDRTLELSRAAARLIPGTARHILVEGNYLLLDQPGWRELADFFATTVMITAPRPLLESRLMQRWQNLSPAQARKKCESNDLPNADLVMSASIASEFTLVTGDP
jgi:pantothenate kinase